MFVFYELYIYIYIYIYEDVMEGCGLLVVVDCVSMDEG